jgi:hypothetical protein
MTDKCLTTWLDYKKRRLKRILKEHFLIDKFYPHSLLVFTLDLSTAYYEEITKFTKLWCNNQTATEIHDEIKAIKEIMEIEEQDNTTWNTELLANKYINERIDSLITGFYAYIEARHKDP